MYWWLLCRLASRLETLDVPQKPVINVLYGGMRKFKQVAHTACAFHKLSPSIWMLAFMMASILKVSFQHALLEYMYLHCKLGC